MPDKLWNPNTNTILRYLLWDEPLLAEKASLFWEDVREGKKKALFLESVLMECVYVLERFYKVPRQDIEQQLQGLLAYEGIANSGQKGLFQGALRNYISFSLDFVDCLLMEYQKQGKGTVFSFNGKLNKKMSRPEKHDLTR
jgi:predicted nucleic-acid-binding protein